MCCRSFFSVFFFVIFVDFFIMNNNKDLFFRHLAQTSDAPLAIEIERAEGCRLYAPGGSSYLDLISGISVSNLGHGNKAVVDAAAEQCRKFSHLLVYGELVQSPQVRFAELLCKQLPAFFDRVYFVNSGAEAVEGACKLAKRYTNRGEIISMVNAYHGSTQGALSLMGSETYKQAFRPLIPGGRHVRFNNTEDLQYITKQTAAVILEPVMSEAGVIAAEEEYLQALRKRCDETGALLIFDEIQTGIGRTGVLFRFMSTGVRPDILLSAKALGAGFPLGAFITSSEIMEKLSYNPVLGHITTFGGHPVSCAAGLAGLGELLTQKLTDGVAEREKLFRQRLAHAPGVKDFRSCGLLMALELESFEENHRVIQFCLKNGLLTDWFLFSPQSLRMAPPLIIQEDEINEACDIIINALTIKET